MFHSEDAREQHGSQRSMNSELHIHQLARKYAYEVALADI